MSGRKLSTNRLRESALRWIAPAHFAAANARCRRHISPYRHHRAKLLPQRRYPPLQPRRLAFLRARSEARPATLLRFRAQPPARWYFRVGGHCPANRIRTAHPESRSSPGECSCPLPAHISSENGSREEECLRGVRATVARRPELRLDDNKDLRGTYSPLPTCRDRDW